MSRGGPPRRGAATGSARAGRAPATRGRSPAGTGRELARGVLGRVTEDAAWANRALSAALKEAPHLAAEERGLATELVYGTLRRQARIDRALGGLLDRPLAEQEMRVRTILRVAAYQILFLSRVPAYAAVSEAVEAAKQVGGPRMGGFVNAVLRRLLREGEPPLPEPGRDLLGFLVEGTGLPLWLGELALRELGQEGALAFGRSFERPAPLWLRANPLRGTWDELVGGLVVDGRREARGDGAGEPQPSAGPVELGRSPLVTEAFRGESLVRPFESAAFREGRFAVQDLGAQVVAHVAGAAAGERILDACAGHGGKTAHLAALADNGALLWAWDRIPSKVSEAKETFARLGLRGATAEVRDILEVAPPALSETGRGSVALFDRVVLDAPCSGLGVLRRHPEALLRRTAGSLAELAATQRALLARLAPWVKPGGCLTYAVCTFDREETDDVVAAFLAAHPDFAVERPTAPALAPLLDERGYVRTWPWRDDADAFFAVRLRRSGYASPHEP